MRLDPILEEVEEAVQGVLAEEVLVMTYTSIILQNIFILLFMNSP